MDADQSLLHKYIDQEATKAEPFIPLTELVETIEMEFGDFDDELTPEQKAELERRAKELRQNPKAGIPWEQVRAEARQRLKARRAA